MASTFTDNLNENSGVLVLGASGQLGQMLRKFWNAPPELVCHSRQPNPEFISFDLILEPEKAVTAMAQKAAVICLSGVTHANAATTGEVYSRNTDLALAAISAAAKANVPRVFLASSAAVYGASPGVQSEETDPSPIAAYGQAKLEMEHASTAIARKLDQPITALRIGNVAGADAILGGWHSAMQIDELPDGSTPTRSYIGPRTLTRVLAQLCQQTDLPEVLNIATPGPIEMGALLDQAGLPWSPRPAPAHVIERVELSTKQLERYVSFAPEDSTAAGMVAEWHQYTKTEKQP